MEFTEERLRFGRDNTIMLLGNQFTKMRETVFSVKHSHSVRDIYELNMFCRCCMRKEQVFSALSLLLWYHTQSYRL